MKKDKRNKKEKLILYLIGVLEELPRIPVKAINKKTAKIIAKSIIEICE